MTAAQRDQAIIIHVTKSFKNVNVPLPKLKTLVEAVCDRFGQCAGPQRGYEISVAVVDDSRMRELNARFLHRKATTDCLSFDLSGVHEEALHVADPKSKMLELVVNGEMAVRQAGLRGHSSEAELALYITHGLLHHLGFDDAMPGRARRMHEAEDEILRQLGYGSVYNKSIRA